MILSELISFTAHMFIELKYVLHCPKILKNYMYSISFITNIISICHYILVVMIKIKLSNQKKKSNILGSFKEPTIKTKYK